jgi:hypothetical protein
VRDLGQATADRGRLRGPVRRLRRCAGGSVIPRPRSVTCRAERIERRDHLIPSIRNSPEFHSFPATQRARDRRRHDRQRRTVRVAPARPIRGLLSPSQPPTPTAAVASTRSATRRAASRPRTAAVGARGPFETAGYPDSLVATSAAPHDTTIERGWLRGLYRRVNSYEGTCRFSSAMPMPMPRRCDGVRHLFRLAASAQGGRLRGPPGLLRFVGVTVWFGRKARVTTRVVLRSVGTTH